jgi:hypothetical protein
MRETARHDGANAENVANDQVPLTAPTPRRPYHPPRVRHLGSVRSLTWGASGQTPDDEGDFQA